MKKALILFAVGGSLILAGPALRAEGPPKDKPAKGARAEAPRGQDLLPPRLAEKLNLSDDQKAKIKAIEESWDKSREQYMAAHKAEADAAREAAKEARGSEDPEKRKAVREQMQKLQAGLKPQRDQYMEQIKSVLSDEQKKTLEEARKAGPPGGARKGKGPGGPPKGDGAAN